MKAERLVHRQRDLQQLAGTAFEAVSGPSFPIAVKVLSSMLVFAVVAFGLMMLFSPAEAPTRPLVAGDIGFLAALAFVIGSGYWGILTSRTSIDGEHIEQTWLWHKKVDIADITQVKLVRVPGLDWLVVPRLVVRTGYGLTTFQTGEPAVLARFRLLAHGG